MKNPYQRDNKWYFFDESQEEHGPFLSQEAAEIQLDQYIKYLG